VLLLSRPFQRHFDSDAKAWKAAVTGAGGSVSIGRLIVVSALISALKNGGIWSNLDRLWVLAAENSQQALVDLVARASATAVNSPAFTANRGYQGNGTSSCIDSNFNAATAGGKFTLNDASHGVWCVIAPTTNGFEICNDFSAYSFVRLNNSGGNLAWAVNDSGAVGAQVTATGGSVTNALWHAQRTGPSAMTLFKNGASFATSTLAGNSAIHSQNHGILANIGATFSDAQLAAAFIGASLSGKEAAFYAAMRTYMTSAGLP
jgi:hypothetical protein